MFHSFISSYPSSQACAWPLRFSQPCLHHGSSQYTFPFDLDPSWKCLFISLENWMRPIHLSEPGYIKGPEPINGKAAFGTIIHPWTKQWLSQSTVGEAASTRREGSIRCGGWQRLVAPVEDTVSWSLLGRRRVRWQMEAGWYLDTYSSVWHGN